MVGPLKFHQACLYCPLLHVDKNEIEEIKPDDRLYLILTSDSGSMKVFDHEGRLSPIADKLTPKFSIENRHIVFMTSGRDRRGLYE